jgi:hypothetical protein
MTIPVRFPDAASLESVLAGLGPASADADLVPALACTFPGFEFSMARIDDAYWRDTRSVIRPDGTRDCRRLRAQQVRLPDQDAACCCAGPTSLTASRGDGHGRHQRSLAAR